MGSEFESYIADFNACIKNGWYKAYGNSLNSPDIGGWKARYGALLVSTRESTIYHVYYVDRYSVMYTLERYSNDGGTTWSEWEYVNPPKEPGVEYRTTERYLGKPVYCKTVNFGALPNASYKFVGIENGASIIRASGLASNGKTLPGSIGASQREQVLCMGSGNSVEIIAYADASSLTATVTAWYTKTAD